MEKVNKMKVYEALKEMIENKQLIKHENQVYYYTHTEEGVPIVLSKWWFSKRSSSNSKTWEDTYSGINLSRKRKSWEILGTWEEVKKKKKYKDLINKGEIE